MVRPPPRSSFGVGFLGIEMGVKEIARLAQRAEELGFATCWLGEDYFFRGAFSLAATCAARTNSLRIGIGTVNPYTRHPALIAMELAGLAEAAGPDRVVLALGASNRAWIEKMHIPYLQPRRSLAETIEIIRAMFRGDLVNYQGQRFQLSEVKFAVSPPARQIPIYLGVVGPKNLELAGERADGVVLSVLTSPPYIRFAWEQIERGAQRVGRRLEAFDLQAYLLISIDPDRRRAREAVKPFLGSLIGWSGFFGPDPILTCTGLTPKEIQPLTEVALAGKDPTPLVSEWMVDTFAVSGTPEDCQESLHRLREAGLTAPVAFEVPGTNFERTLSYVQQFLFSC